MNLIHYFQYYLFSIKLVIIIFYLDGERFG